MPSPSGVTPSPDRFHRLLLAARGGSSEALGELLMACQSYLWLVASQQLGAELRTKIGASDLVQDTFLEAQRDFGRFTGATEAEWLAWLRRILLNNLVNATGKFRTQKRHVRREVSLEALAGAESVPEEHLVAPEAPPEDRLLAQEEAQLLDQALGQLSEDHQRVIRLRHREHRSFEEIGQALGRSAEAGRKLWARAIERLQELLEPPHEPQ